MATPVTISNTALVAVKGHVGTQKVVNVFAYQVTATPITTAKVDDLATWWGNVGWVQLRNVLPTYYVLEEIDVRSVDPGLHYQRVITPTGTQQGARVGDIEQGVTSPINWHSTIVGRSSRGRTSIGPVSESDVQGEQLGTTLVNLLINFATFLVTNHPSGEWVFSIGSRKLHIPYAVVAGVVQALVGSMSSRLSRHGN